MIFKETLPLNARPKLEILWCALWERVENPHLFLAALESFAIIEKKEDAIYRRLHFPQNIIVRDIVHWEKHKWIAFDVIPNGASISGSLTLTIEGNEETGFAIQFAYETMDHSAEEEHLAEYVKSAYHHANLSQMVRLETLCSV